MSVATGAQVYADMSWENTAGAAGTDKFLLGKYFELRNVGTTEGQSEHMNLNQIEVAGFQYGQRSRTLGFAWVLSSPWFLEAVMGRGSRTTPAISNGVYTHTYTVKKIPQAFTCRIGTALDTDEVRTFQACLLNQVGISTRVGDTVNVTANAISGKEGGIGTSLDASPGSDRTDFPYTFEYSTVEVPSGTAVGKIQNFSLDINPNYNLLYGLGNKDSVDAWKGAINYSGNIQIPKEDGDFLARVTGRSETATMKVKFTNGQTAANEKSITLTLAGVGFSEGSFGAKAVDLVQDTYNFTARSVTAVAINDDAAPTE